MLFMLGYYLFCITTGTHTVVGYPILYHNLMFRLFATRSDNAVVVLIRDAFNTVGGALVALFTDGSFCQNKLQLIN